MMMLLFCSCFPAGQIVLMWFWKWIATYQMAAKDKEIEDLKRRVIEVNSTCFLIFYQILFSYILSNLIKTKGNMYDDFFIGSKTVWGNLWDKTGRPTGGWNDNHKLMMDIFHESLPQEMCLLFVADYKFWFVKTDAQVKVYSGIIMPEIQRMTR